MSSADPTARTLVFVYGTLKRGLENAHYLAGQEFIGQALTEPLYRMVDCIGYPGLYRPDDSTTGLAIHGEVWSVDTTARLKLDELEDIAAGLYTIEPIQLQPPFADRAILAYYYAWPRESFSDAGDNWGKN